MSRRPTAPRGASLARDLGKVAARDFGERLRSRAFIASSAFLVVFLVVMSALPAVIGRLLADDDEPYALAADPASAAVADLAAAAPGMPAGRDIVVLPADGRATAIDLVRAGEADGALVDGATLLYDGLRPAAVEHTLGAALAERAFADALEGAGVDADEVLAAARAPALRAEPVDDSGPRLGVDVGVVLAAVTILFIMVFTYGGWVAQGIVEEKQSRVVEIVLSTVRPESVLAGKVVGVGTLGLLQTLMLAGVGLGGAVALGNLQLSASALGGVLLAVAWFLPGFGLYAMLYAVTGALVPRVEELQSAQMPIMLPLFGGIVGAQIAFNAPDALSARVLGLLPFTAPMVQPVRAALGSAQLWEIAAALAGTVALTALLVPLAARAYRGGALQVGTKVPLRRVLRSAGD